MPIAARMPASSAARAAASGKKYMSLKQVTPPRSISAQASSVPSCTNAGDTMLRLDRPDVVAQPVHQRAVVGQAAHQRHRRVRMQVDEAGDEHVLGELDACSRRDSAREPPRSGSTATMRLAAIDDGVVVEHAPGGLDRNHPARFDDRYRRLHALTFMP